MRFGSSAVPQIAFRVGVAVEKIVEPRTEFLLDIGLFRLAVQIEPLVGIVLEIVQLMWTVRVTLDVLPFSGPDGPNPVYRAEISTKL